MSDRIFIDSNLLIYSIDDGEPVKRLTAKSILETLAKNGGVISTQVLQEFYNIVSGKLKCPKDIAKQLVENVASDFTVHKNSVQDILHAIEISIRTQFSFWDSLIISAALAENCTTLYSEDLNDGQTVEGMLIYNPLKGNKTCR